MALERLGEQARRAETSGFTGLWISDHYRAMYVQQIGPDQAAYFDAFEEEILPHYR